jgi:UDP-glucose:(heptosyl)LPS alpha-1,3-glucosyltransferase
LALGSLWLSHAAARAAAAAQTPQLIVTNGFMGAGFPPSIPRVHVYHGTMVRDSLCSRAALSRRELVRRVFGAGMAEALSARHATVVCVSENAAAEVRRYYRVRSDTVLPNPVDTSVFRPLARARARQSLGLPGDARLALFVGRPEHRKGFHLLAGAARRAGYELTTAGPGDMSGTRQLGVLDPPRLALAYSAADCVLLPSSYEACSFVVLEALACGVPLLTTRVGWMNDFLALDPAYGALCVTRDETEIADRLSRLPELATPELIGRAQQWVSAHHNLDRYARRWAELLRSRVGVG